MQEIENQALRTYQANLDYFQKKHKKLFEKVKLLDTLIQGGKYIENFVLDYKDEGYFDIKDLRSDTYLYNENSIAHAKYITDLQNKLRQGSVFRAQRDSELSNEECKIIEESKLSFHNTQWSTASITHYVQNHVSVQTFMTQVYKAIFINIGLGLHIGDVVKKLGSKILFIKEKNLEIFRLSLFVTNYEDISKDANLFFSIMEPVDMDQKIFTSFLNTHDEYNLFMKYVSIWEKPILELRQLQEYFVAQPFISYGYHAELLRYISSPKYLVMNYPYLNLNQRNKTSFIAEKPVLLVLSGPSSAKNIQWIKSNRDRFIVISALSTCRLLHKHNIIPDIVLHIDPGKETTARLFEGLEESYFENIHVVASSNIHEDTIQRFNRNKVYIAEQGTRYKKDFGMLTAPSVGEYSYALALIFGAKRIFMIGLDLALDHETLQTHGDHHAFNEQGLVDTESNVYDPKTFASYVKGNFINEVPTTGPMKHSIEQFRIFTELFKMDNQEVFNLSDGAYLEGSIPLKLENYEWNTLKEVPSQERNENLKIFLEESSQTGLNTNDKGELRYQVKQAKKLEQKIKIFQSKKFSEIDIFWEAFIKLTKDLTIIDSTKKIDLGYVYKQYFQIIKSFIFDLCNRDNENNSQVQEAEEIHTLVCRELLKMASLYLTHMQNYIK